MLPTREQAYDLLKRYNSSESLLIHGMAVESVMRYFAEKNNENPEYWGIVGLLHDLDYEQFPQEHCYKTQEIMRQENIDEDIIHAIISHGYGICIDVKPERYMEKVLYTIDELTGLINATILMRPSKSIMDLPVKSVKKKFKAKGFAAGVNREVILKGCELIDMELSDVIAETIEGMKTNAEALNLA